MATGVEELVDMLFDMIDEAKNAPLSGEKCVIERDKALDLLDDIKAQFPVELAEARKILNARSEYVAAAKREADEIRKRAEIEASQLINEDKVMNLARQKANELVAQAEVKAKEVRRAANEYCEDVLRRTEDALADAHSEMKQVRSRFRSAVGGSSPAPAGNSRVYDAEADEA
jgi:cell division septum initiation protein DivIVA